jgi:hypothetical protein
MSTSAPVVPSTSLRQRARLPTRARRSQRRGFSSSSTASTAAVTRP